MESAPERRSNSTRPENLAGPLPPGNSLTSEQPVYSHKALENAEYENTEGPLGTRYRIDWSIIAVTSRRRAHPYVTVGNPREGVVEACVVVRGAKRIRAAALRLEGYDRRWRATSFTIL